MEETRQEKFLKAISRKGAVLTAPRYNVFMKNDLKTLIGQFPTYKAIAEKYGVSVDIVKTYIQRECNFHYCTCKNVGLNEIVIEKNNYKREANGWYDGDILNKDKKPGVYIDSNIRPKNEIEWREYQRKKRNLEHMEMLSKMDDDY